MLVAEIIVMLCRSSCMIVGFVLMRQTTATRYELRLRQLLVRAQQEVDDILYEAALTMQVRKATWEHSCRSKTLGFNRPTNAMA
jgi:hypothetical protein